MGRAMTDVAYDVIIKRKRAVPFTKIWDEVSISKKFTQEQKDNLVADFFSDLSCDERFVNIGENKWDIKSRRKFKDVFVDADAIAVDDDDE